MSDPKPLSPGLKLALDLGPVLLFFVTYLWVKDDTFTIGGRDYSGFIVVTAGFVPVLLASIALIWKLTGKVSRMQVVTAVLVVVFGGLTVLFNDESFFKMKTTLVYGLFAALLGAGLLRGSSLLAWVMEEMMPLTEEGFLILTRRLTAMFAAMAVANEVIWRTLPTETWVKIETFAFPAALFAFFMLQGKLFEAHGTEEAGEKDA
jgi:intracellular septation protein